MVPCVTEKMVVSQRLTLGVDFDNKKDETQ